MAAIDITLASIAILLLAMTSFASLTINSSNAVSVMSSFAATSLTHYFAPQLGAISLLLAAAAVTFGSGGWPGWLTVAAALATALVCLRVHRAGHETGPVVERAVDAALARLGEDTPVKTADATASALRCAGLRPFRFPRQGVSVLRDQPYGDAGGANCLDIYQPQQRPEGLMPILIQVPGGAWVTGDKKYQALPLLYHMAQHGWTCFAINYRLAPQHRFPAMLEDVLRAIAWVRAHAADYGADPGFVAITGGSAGGHLTSLAALLRDRARYQPGFEDADTRVDLAVPIYGRYDFLNLNNLLPEPGLEPFLTRFVMPGPPESCRELWEAASPQLQVHADAPPFFVVHGSGDAMIPAAEARAFVDALGAVSTQAVDYAELPHAEHAFDMLCTSWSMHTVFALRRLLQGYYDHHQAGRSG